MTESRSAQTLLSVRSQLGEQMLAWLAYQRDYPNNQAMPGKNFGLPPYYDATLGRRPTDLYIPPIVKKRIPKRDLQGNQSHHKASTDSTLRRSRSVTNDTQSLGGESQEELPTGHDLGDFDTISVHWADELRSAPPGLRSLIYGAPGQGKSWLIQNTASQLAKKAYDQLDSRSRLPGDLILPICLRTDDLIKQCGKQAQLDGHDATDFESKHVRRAVKLLLHRIAPFDSSSTRALPHLGEYVANHLHEDRFWLLLDALDEFSADDENTQLLHQFFIAIKSWRIRVLVTARPYAKTRFNRAAATSSKETTFYELDKLDPYDAEAFVSLWFNSKDPSPDTPLSSRLRQQNYREITESPQLLTLLCVAASNPQSNLPTNSRVTRSQIYEAMFASLFRYTTRQGEDTNPISFGAAAPHLENIAQHMVTQGEVAAPSANIHQLHRILVDKTGAKENETFSLEDEERANERLTIFKRLRILVPTTHDHDSDWHFSHREFASFFAGRSFAAACRNAAPSNENRALSSNKLNTSTIQNHLACHIWDPDWERIASFFVGYTKHPENFFRLLRNTEVTTSTGERLGNDKYIYRLFAASRLMMDMPTIRSTFNAKTPTSIYRLIARDVIKSVTRQLCNSAYSWPLMTDIALIGAGIYVRSSDKCINHLLSVASKNSHLFVRSSAAAILGKIATYAEKKLRNHIAIRLEYILMNDREAAPKIASAIGLGELIATSYSQIQERIHSTLRDSFSSNFHYAARTKSATVLIRNTYYLQYDFKRDLLDEIILSLKRDWPWAEYDDDCNIILEYIAKQTDRNTHKELIQSFISTIKHHSSYFTRAATSSALSTFARHLGNSAHNQTIVVLKNILQDDEDSYTRYVAARELSLISAQTTNRLRNITRAILKRSALSNLPTETRLASIESLGRIVTKNANSNESNGVVEFLSSLVEKSESEINSHVALVFSRLIKIDEKLFKPTLLPQINSLFATDDIWNHVDCYRASTIIFEYLPRDMRDRIVDRFDYYLNENYGSLERGELITCLAQIITQSKGIPCPRAFQIFQSRLLSSDSYVRIQAIKDFGLMLSKPYVYQENGGIDLLVDVMANDAYGSDLGFSPAAAATSALELSMPQQPYDRQVLISEALHRQLLESDRLLDRRQAARSLDSLICGHSKFRFLASKNNSTLVFRSPETLVSTIYSNL